MAVKIDELLRVAAAFGASDLHCKAGSQPFMRIGGELRGGGSILDRGLKAIVKSGSPPPRIVICRPPPRPAKPVVLFVDPSPFEVSVMTQDAGRCHPTFRLL